MISKTGHHTPYGYIDPESENSEQDVMSSSEYFDHCLEKEFYLSDEHIEACESYYVLRWTGSHLRAMVAETNRIMHQGKIYLVSFRSEHDAARCYSSAQVKISFRFPNEYGNHLSYAVVRRMRLPSVPALASNLS